MKLLLPRHTLPSKNYKWLLLPVLLLAFILAGTPGKALAQGHQRVVQLSGFVTFGDSLYGVSGVSVYVPNTTRGIQTNQYGFFSLPVLAGDSVVFSALGYKKQYLIIPKNYKSNGYSIIMQMQEEAIELPEVAVFPWPTERDFKQALLNVKLPDEGRAVANRNLDPALLEELFRTTPMDGGANFKVWNKQNVQRIEQTKMFPTISPFAIPALINMIKNGDFKKK
ncbi:carboxypeptidase-like regulatory domain-containing protein [Pontibacter vulgaris]|uniref:carboxypeptidase-like regulatory domain-containing protein n=1 Tax=Pontibacter vulgaris TaxID=2905679 RepID=UPI001FA72337|nr:carboxypeptidase-like regulatory domain-containing protein [Pontibacter vulgaris]